MKTNFENFIPPHCPHRNCPYFLPPKDLDWYNPAGSHSTATHGTVPRYRCTACKKSFSRQTFDLHYYGKRRISWGKIQNQVRNCISDRALARELNVSPTTVANKTHRLSQWSLAHHHSMVDGHKLTENLSADGFETFTKSQFYPGHLNNLVGDKSQICYSWDYTTIRRKGRMTPAQKRRRAVLEKSWKPKRAALAESFRRGVLTPMKTMFPEERITLTTDENPLYVQVIGRDEELVKYSGENKYTHIQVSSKLVRDRKNPLFAVNYMDREIRKDLANHVKETTRFSREVNHMMERMNVYLVDHNCRKRFRIKDRKAVVRWHWQEAGINAEKVEVQEFGDSLFRPWKPVDLGESFKRMWERDIPGPEPKVKKYIPQFWKA